MPQELNNKLSRQSWLVHERTSLEGAAAEAGDVIGIDG